MSTKSDKEIFSKNDSEYVMYLVVNNDLKMGKGKIAAQCAHAACKVTRILERYKPTPKYYKTWEKNAEPKIVLKSDKEQINELLEKYALTKQRFSIDNIWCVPIRDAGRTQIKAMGWTADTSWLYNGLTDPPIS